LKRKRKKAFMVGFLEIRGRVGLIVKLASLVADKKEKREKDIQRVGQQWLCAIVERDSKRDLKEYLGKLINKFMPYDLRKFKGGYKVCKKNGSKCFSKKPMPKARAERQIAALHINTNESVAV
jgi:hypothetical protein